MRINRPLRIGLIGCGRWGNNILRDLCALGTHVYVSDLAEEARSRALSHGAYESFDTSSALPLVDGIVIATPTEDHAKSIQSVLDRQVPVFCEKPLTADVAQAEEIVSRDENRLVFLMDKWRYHPGVQALGNITRDGILGSVQGIQTTRVQWGQPHTDVDGVWILAPHDLSIVHQILGYLPEPVHAVADFTDHHMDGLTAFFGHDPSVIINVSSRAPRTQRMVSLSCTEGVAVLADPLADHIELWRCHSENGFVQKPEKYAISTEMPLFIELKHFCDYLLGGKEPLTNSVEAARHVAVIEQLRRMATRN